MLIAPALYAPRAMVARVGTLNQQQPASIIHWTEANITDYYVQHSRPVLRLYITLQLHRRIGGGGRGGLGPPLEKLISLAGQKRELGRTEMGAWQDRNGKLGRR